MPSLTLVDPSASGPETSGRFEAGLEIVDTKLDTLFAEKGIVPVSSVSLDDDGLAIYEIRRNFTQGSLDKALERGLINRGEALEVALDALQVVSEVQKQGLLAHGNIQPHNIFLDGIHHTGVIGGFRINSASEKALVDMGVDVSGLRSDEDEYMNLAFTAPEVVMGEVPDARSDVYEGARTLLYALSGKRPPPTVKYFDDVIGSPLEPARAPDLSTDFPMNTPNSVRFAIQQALDPKPDNRQTMQQLIEEVQGEVYPLAEAVGPVEPVPAVETLHLKAAA
ncbi:MAG TPA: hypothetical protein VFW77_01165 [Candidatus Saccharimonadales bacterium]|nr:hypothetical protein [Candidatus Saccharimonadales bacterium]